MTHFDQTGNYRDLVHLAIRAVLALERIADALERSAPKLAQQSADPELPYGGDVDAWRRNEEER